MSTQQIRLPIGGPIVTRTFYALGALAVLSGALLLWRFVFGIGRVTALNDGYPWGLWIAFDVVVGTALATGGYVVAILIYVLNRGHYHPLVRSALVTSGLGYALGGFGVLIDLGRYWNVYKVPTMFWRWNLNSVLLEVALCITAYTAVVWVELAPSFLDKWKSSPNKKLGEVSAKAYKLIEWSLPWLIALGVLLPTMHQSSLGALMMIAGIKLHPLWNTPILPLLFLLSCVGMGFAAVVVESVLSSGAFKRPFETDLLRPLSRVIGIVLWIYLIIRVADLALRGRLGLALSLDRYSLLFLVELTLFVVPAVMLSRRKAIQKLRYLFTGAALMLAAGALYRFSTFLIAFNPGQGWRYFPATTELLVTVGLVSAEIIAYIAIVKRFPILVGATRKK